MSSNVIPSPNNTGEITERGRATYTSTLPSDNGWYVVGYKTSCCVSRSSRVGIQ